MGWGAHASGGGLGGYLLLHSAFGPSSVQLREKTAREGEGRGDTEHGEDWARPRALRWAKMRIEMGRDETNRQTNEGQGLGKPTAAAHGRPTTGLTAVSGSPPLPLLQPRLWFKARRGHILDPLPSPL